MALSPMMQQYFNIKNQYEDSILFFRLGDFYEMFFKDAEIASKELEITLTGRDCGQEERAPMCQCYKLNLQENVKIYFQKHLTNQKTHNNQKEYS